MTKYFLFLLTFINCFHSNSQDLINQKDSLGRKQGHWIVYKDPISDSIKLEEGDYVDGKKEGFWVKYHEDGITPKIKGEYTNNRPKGTYTKGGYYPVTTSDSLRHDTVYVKNNLEEGMYVNDRKEGLWIKYHEDGKTPKLKGFYVNNRPSGKYWKYYENSQLRECGFYSKNMQSDSLKRYFESGQLEYEAWYDENGKAQGRVNYFYPSGQLEFTYIAVDNVPKNTEHYDQTGKLISKNDTPCYYPAPVSQPIKQATPEESAKHPLPKMDEPPNTHALKFQPNGYNKVFNSDDEIEFDGVFKNGQLWDGKVYIYDKDGILLWVRIYKNGIYHSDGQL